MKSWQLFGGPGTPLYALYDSVRRRLNRKLADYLGRQSNRHHWSRFLEAGSGPAFASSLLARKPGRLSVALDLDMEALRQARRRDPILPMVLGDLHRLPFKTGAFDLAWSSSTLEHLDQPADVLAEMRRVVRQDGCVFVGVPYRSGPLGFQPLIKNTDLGIWLGRVFSRDALRALLRQAHLEPVESISYFFGFFIGILAQKT